MKPKVVKLNGLKQNDYGLVKVTDLLSDKNYTKLSVARVERIKDAKYGYNTKSDSIYYVLKGKGTSVIEGKRYQIKVGNLLFIPKGTKYKNSKGLTLLAIQTPKFNANSYVYLE